LSRQRENASEEGGEGNGECSCHARVLLQTNGCCSVPLSPWERAGVRVFWFRSYSYSEVPLAERADHNLLSFNRHIRAIRGDVLPCVLGRRGDGQLGEVPLRGVGGGGELDFHLALIGSEGGLLRPGDARRELLELHVHRLLVIAAAGEGDFDLL